MTQYKSANVKLSNSQLHQWKSEIKMLLKKTLKYLSNAVDDSIDEAYFPHKLLFKASQSFHKYFMR